MLHFCDAGHPAIAFLDAACPVCVRDPIVGHVPPHTRTEALQAAFEAWLAEQRQRRAWDAVLQRARTAPDHYALLEFQLQALWEAGQSLPVGAQIVELGVCHGKTAIVLATLAQQRQGTYLGVDTWELEGSRDDVAARLAAVSLGPPTVQLLAARTQDAPIPPRIDLLLIDAGHDEANVRADCERWIPALVPGGLLAAHDYDDPYNPQSAHWAVRHYVDHLTGHWTPVGLWGGLLLRRRPVLDPQETP